MQWLIIQQHAPDLVFQEGLIRLTFFIQIPWPFRSWGSRLSRMDCPLQLIVYFRFFHHPYSLFYGPCVQAPYEVQVLYFPGPLAFNMPYECHIFKWFLSSVYAQGMSTVFSSDSDYNFIPIYSRSLSLFSSWYFQDHSVKLRLCWLLSLLHLCEDCTVIIFIYEDIYLQYSNHVFVSNETLLFLNTSLAFIMNTTLT